MLNVNTLAILTITLTLIPHFYPAKDKNFNGADKAINNC